MTAPLNDDWDQDELRTRFCMALSEMYKSEVPLYGDLVDIVNEVDARVLRAGGHEQDTAEHVTQGKITTSNDELLRVLPLRHRLERHGAIRLGTPEELQTVRRLFGILGMYPVGYYDLSVVGFPMHATAFRPITREALAKNPFRVFTTLLRPELISERPRALALKALSKRCIFTNRLLELIDLAEKSQGTTKTTTDPTCSLSLSRNDAEELVTEALHTFRWHSTATTSLDEYRELKLEHPLLADIASFPSSHINHLTPRTLDIDLVQTMMLERGIPAKDIIEGPPRRKCAILLRQTSFKALEEPVQFADGKGGVVQGSHTARFGEIEQRGAAVTPKGRALYDELNQKVETEVAALKGASSPTTDPSIREALHEKYFRSFPDDIETLCSQGLLYLWYKLTPQAIKLLKTTPPPETSYPTLHSRKLSDLISSNLITFEPITYEDFLPFSAGGIFKSNLNLKTPTNGTLGGTTKSPSHKVGPDREGLEKALGIPVVDEFSLYQREEEESIERCRVELGLGEIVV